MPYEVVFTPEADDQLAALYRYISEKASPEVALNYTSAIIDHCQSLKELPRRVVRRDDIRPGLYITHHKGRTVIAFTVDTERIYVIGIYYGGRDYEARLQFEADE
jgi:toxin ParE1/3/4